MHWPYMMSVDSVEQQIDAALDAGDIETAAMLAATLPKPQHYRDAMIRVNRVVQLHMTGRPMIALTEQAGKLIKFTPYVEMHGKDPVSGAALRLEFNVASTFLAGFDPELRAFLFNKTGAKSHDLADQTAELPNLRFDKIKPPYLYRQKYDGSVLTIHIGDRANNAIVLQGKVKKPFALTPMEGGTLVVGMTFNCHPETKDVGTIYNLQRNDIRISFSPGEEVDDNDDEDTDDETGEGKAADE